MRALDKTGIYIDFKKLRRILQRAQVCMTKSDRIIYGTPMLAQCAKALGDFVMAYDFEDERTYYIKKMIADFTVLRVDIETVNECGIIRAVSETRRSTPPERTMLVVEKPDILRRELSELVAKIDQGIQRYKNSVILADYRTSEEKDLMTRYNNH